MGDWNELKKAHYKSKDVVLSEYGAINFDPDSLKEVVRGERLSYDDVDTPVKYYFTDMGLRNARLNFRQLEETHSMENIIFNELKIRGYNVDVGVVCQYETNEKGNIVRRQLEIDFVCNKGSMHQHHITTRMAF